MEENQNPEEVMTRRMVGLLNTLNFMGEYAQLSESSFTEESTAEERIAELLRLVQSLCWDGTQLGLTIGRLIGNDAIIRYGEYVSAVIAKETGVFDFDELVAHLGYDPIVREKANLAAATEEEVAA